ncbi:MAG: hypothetical protein ABMA14_05155 [Hyphomonadaceae bacterium]
MRAIVLAGIAVTLPPLAIAQVTPQELLGAWSCSAQFDDGKIWTWDASYLADGKLRAIRFNWPEFEPGGPFLETQTTFEGNWKVEGGKLIEQLGRQVEMSIVVMENGIRKRQVIPGGEDTRERPFEYSVTFKGNTFSATAPDGLVNSCKRRTDQ